MYSFAAGTELHRPLPDDIAGAHRARKDVAKLR